MPKSIITEEEIAPIVKDFVAYAEYVEKHPILLTKSQQWLPRKALQAINERMAAPEQQVTAYSDQISYPLLHLFYHLGLAAKLFRKEQQPKGQQALLPTERLPLFYQLTTAEKYMALLETLWIDCDWEDIRGKEARSGMSIIVDLVFRELEQVPPGNTIVASKDKSGSFLHLFSNFGYFVHYFCYFGFWEMTKDEEKSALFGKFHYEVKTLTPAPLFYFLGIELYYSRELSYWNLAMRREKGDLRGNPGEPLPGDDEEWEPELFIDAMTHYFPKGELVQSLPRETSAFFDGTYVLKIALRPNCWRSIQLSSHFTLYDLHMAIQEAFEFDDDHLYAFFMDGKTWSSKYAFYSPDAGDTPVVTDVRLGELNLSAGQSFLYLFDFGDEWEFTVTVEELLTTDTRKAKPRTIEEKGKSPAQYY
ncbi:plasmid pRiA4b ORF-3 family protein [Paenibacillus sp. GCM10027626]|uniref:plasmid pRiA4b ORF-3 family protein n=1 Tax=Paenibacillus sp. GCM10027626 TaxID=3273411 RepID=UPI00362CF681